MQSIKDCTLDELIDMAKQQRIVDGCHKNDWNVTLSVGPDQFILNHSYAHIFLQGLLRGVWQFQHPGRAEVV